MSRVLATYNIKGGVGKTSAAVNLATLAAHERRADAAVGPRPAGREHVPVPRARRRSRAAARKLVRGKSDVDALLKGTDTEGLDLLPADFSYRHMDLALGDAKTPDERGLDRVLEPLAGRVRLHVPGLPAEHLARVGVACSRPPTRCWCRSSRRRSRSRTLEQLHSVLAGDKGPQVLGFFSMADRRKKLHRELMDSLARSTTCSRP